MTTPSQRKPVILVVCTGNSCRSQMAEAFLRRAVGDQYEVVSAGLHPKPIHSLTLQVMKEIGIDLEAEGHRPKGVKEFLGKLSVKHLIVVCAEAEAECPRLFPGAANKLFGRLMIQQL